MTRKTLFFCSDDKNDEELGLALSQSLGCRYQKVQRCDEVIDGVSSDITNNGFIAFEKLTEAGSRLKGLPPEQANRMHLVFPADGIPTVQNRALDESFGNFIIRTTRDHSEAAARYAPVLKTTMNQKSFGIQQFGFPAGTKQEFMLYSSHQKSLAASAVAQELAACGLSSRVARVMASAVDELLMNAFFDAPVDAKGEQIHKKTPRTDDIPSAGVKLQMGITDESVGFVVSDSIGQLNRAKVLWHTLRQGSTANISTGENDGVGAGIGLAMIFQSGGSLCFHTQIGKCTEVGVFFKRTSSMAEFRKQFQFISTLVVI
jgi:hypothetical protein